MYRLLWSSLALATFAACTPSTSPTSRPAVRSDLVLAPEAAPEDSSILVAQYREWGSDGQRIPHIELDHGHGPAEEDDEDEVLVLARVGNEAVPVQAIDAEGDHVRVDLDALPMGPQTLHLSVVHDGLTSDELAVSVIDRRLAAP